MLQRLQVQALLAGPYPEFLTRGLQKGRSAGVGCVFTVVYLCPYDCGYEASEEIVVLIVSGNT